MHVSLFWRFENLILPYIVLTPILPNKTGKIKIQPANKYLTRLRFVNFRLFSLVCGSFKRLSVIQPNLMTKANCLIPRNWQGLNLKNTKAKALTSSVLMTPQVNSAHNYKVTMLPANWISVNSAIQKTRLKVKIVVRVLSYGLINGVQFVQAMVYYFPRINKIKHKVNTSMHKLLNSSFRIIKVMPRLLVKLPRTSKRMKLNL